MSIRYEINGMPDSGDLEYSDEFLVRLVKVTPPDRSGDPDVTVELMVVREPDAVVRARQAYTQAARLSSPDPANLAVAAALLLACDRLESIDDALRNTVGGVSR